MSEPIWHQRDNVSVEEALRVAVCCGHEMVADITDGSIDLGSYHVGNGEQIEETVDFLTCLYCDAQLAVFSTKCCDARTGHVLRSAGGRDNYVAAEYTSVSVAEPCPARVRLAAMQL